MQSKWFTYSFLAVMVVALVSLAVLQYHWLGSVSQAEKERLQASLSAASENFVSDFNEVFEQIGQVFKVRLDDPGEDLSSLINTSFLEWLSIDRHPNLLEDIYLIRPSDTEIPDVFFFSSDPATLVQVSPDSEILIWIENNYEISNNGALKTPLRVHPDFADQTFLSVPIQYLDMVEIARDDIETNFEVRLSIDQLDDLILLKLDDSYIKKEIIPEIARTYLSESFEDQYDLTILDDRDPQYIYYTTAQNSIPEPDFNTQIDRFSFSNILVFQSDESNFTPITLPGNSDSLDISIGGNESLSSWTEDIAESLEGNSEAHIIAKSVASTRINTDSAYVSYTRDTTVTSKINATMNASAWSFWLTFKDGSLVEYVAKTRNRNLGISFGILLLLGISGGMIVLFSQRSRELAEQQMLFVAGVSHELRTPLTVIRSAAENLSEGVIQSETRKKDYADLMLKEGRRLSDMVDQIMEFSGIQTGKKTFNFSDVEINSMVSKLQDEVAHLLIEKNMKLELSNLAKTESIYADGDAVVLAVSNLLKNSIKFSDEGSIIILKLEDVALKGRKALQVEVQDFGMGIPEAELSDIFKPFFRGNKSVEDQIKGNGIGLSLVQRVAEAHQGEIQAKSKPGEGSSFRFIIPIEA